MKALSERYKLVLVSNFYGNIQTILKDFGLFDFFADIIESSVVGVMLRLDQWHTGQRTFSMHVCLAETCLVHRHLKLFILAPQYFRPMTAVCIDCSSVIKDYAFYICQFTHL